MVTSQLYDVIIIGAGPTGLSAAWIFSFTGLRYIIFGDIDESAANFVRKPYDFPLNIKEKNGEDILYRLKLSIETIAGGITNKLIVAIYRENEDVFTVVDSDGIKYYCRNVLFAPGVMRSYISIQGMDYYRYRGFDYSVPRIVVYTQERIVGLIGSGDELLKLTPKLTLHPFRLILFVLDDVLHGDLETIDFVRMNPSITVFENVEPIELVGDKDRLRGLKIKTDHDQEYIVKLDLLISVPVISRPVPDLTEMGIEYDGPYVKVDKNFETKVKNFFAGGDVTGGRLSMIKAFNEGFNAAHSILDNVYKSGKVGLIKYLGDLEYETPRRNRFSVKNARRNPLVEEVEKWETMYMYYEFYAPIQEKFERLAKEFPKVKVEAFYNPKIPSTWKIIPYLAKITAFLDWEVESVLSNTFSYPDTIRKVKSPVIITLYLDGKMVGRIENALKFGRIEDDLYYMLKGMYDDEEVWEAWNPGHYDKKFEEKYS